VESAVTAAVRLGYQVAEAQIDRTARVAKRFRDAAGRAAGGKGAGTEGRQALDATEQIIFKTMMAGLSFLEGAAVDHRNPIRRAATAQFRLLGSMLGLLPPDDASSSSARSPADSTSADRFERESPRQPAPRPARGSAYPRIKHAKGSRAATLRRAVRIERWEVSNDTAEGRYPLVFYNAAATGTFHRGA
jgi:hypothetical protein